MFRNPRILSRGMLCAVVFTLVAVAGCAANAQMGAGGSGDKRKQTTIQTAQHGPVKVQFLNLPFGEKTFQYLANGGDDYYSNRSWPFAHMTLSKSAWWQGKELPAGDYVLYLTPKSASAPLSLTVASFKPGASGTFLVAGDVFTETPADTVAIATVPATFAQKAPAVDHLDVSVASAGDGADLNVHYGDHWLTEHLTVK